MTAAIRTNDHLTIVFDDGVPATVYDSNPRFQDIVTALKNKDYGLVRRLAIPAEQVKSNLRNTFGITEEQVTIEHGIVLYHGKEMDNTLTRRMIQMLEEGFDIAPLKLFLINLQANPSYRAVNELYGFLEKGNLPITEDGYFLAYKKVRADYKDVHTGMFDNSVGQLVQMARNEVDEDSRNECSNGLHFCSREYLNNFGGDHIMIVKINPADVVAIPADYNSSKGRTCRYEVIGELEQEGKLEGSFRNTGMRSSLQADIENTEVFHIDHDADQHGDGDWEDCDICNRPDDVTDSAFVGIPGDGEPVVIPRSVALEIAADLADDEEDLEPVIAICHNPNQFLTFDDIADGAAHADVTVSAIRRVLRGERKSTGGYEWKSAKDQVTDLHRHGTIFGGNPHKV